MYKRLVMELLKRVKAEKDYKIIYYFLKGMLD